MYHRVCLKRLPCQLYIRCKLCNYLASKLILSPKGPKQASNWPMFHQEVPSGVPKKISMPVVHSVQTMLLYCIEVNSISKWSKTSFDLTNVTEKYHWVCLKRFPCLRYIRRKLYTDLLPRLTLSPNGPKRASTWHMSPRSTIGCAQNDFHAYGTFGAKRAPI
jgi:hypothetical protein